MASYPCSIATRLRPISAGFASHRLEREVEMDLEPSEEQRLIVDTTRRFVRDQIVPLEADLDPDAGELEPGDQARLVAMVKGMGFYGLDIPEEYGGPGIDIITR